jgi:ribosomal protein L40E
MYVFKTDSNWIEDEIKNILIFSLFTLLPSLIVIGVGIGIGISAGVMLIGILGIAIFLYFILTKIVYLKNNKNNIIEIDEFHLKYYYEKSHMEKVFDLYNCIVGYTYVTGRRGGILNKGIVIIKISDIKNISDDPNDLSKISTDIPCDNISLDQWKAMIDLCSSKAYRYIKEYNPFQKRDYYLKLISSEPGYKIKKDNETQSDDVKTIGSKEEKKMPESEDKIIRSKELWICSRCGTENELSLDNCKKCGKEFNPPL